MNDDADIRDDLLLPVWLTAAAVFVGAILLHFDPAIGAKGPVVLIAVGAVSVGAQLAASRITRGRFADRRGATESAAVPGRVEGATPPPSVRR